MKTKLREWQLQYEHLDKISKWEIMKYEIRKFTIKFSKSKKKEINRQKHLLEHKLCHLERNLTNEENRTEYNDVKQQLNEIQDREIDGAILRSKIQWYELRG